VGEWGSLGYLGLKLRYPVMYFLSCIFLCTLYWSTGVVKCLFLCVFILEMGICCVIGDGDFMGSRECFPSSPFSFMKYLFFNQTTVVLA